MGGPGEIMREMGFPEGNGGLWSHSPALPPAARWRKQAKSKSGSGQAQPLRGGRVLLFFFPPQLGFSFTHFSTKVFVKKKTNNKGAAA